MKIISKPDATWSDKITCGACTSVLEVDHNDIKFKTEKEYHNDIWGGDRFSQEVEKYYVDCPVCFRIIYLKKDNIPFILKEKLRNKR